MTVPCGGSNTILQEIESVKTQEGVERLAPPVNH